MFSRGINLFLVIWMFFVAILASWGSSIDTEIKGFASIEVIAIIVALIAVANWVYGLINHPRQEKQLEDYLSKLGFFSQIKLQDSARLYLQLKNEESDIFYIFIENDQLLSIRRSETIIKKINGRFTVLNNDDLCIVEDFDNNNKPVLYR